MPVLPHCRLVDWLIVMYMHTLTSLHTHTHTHSSEEYGQNVGLQFVQESQTGAIDPGDGYQVCCAHVCVCVFGGRVGTVAR